MQIYCRFQKTNIRLECSRRSWENVFKIKVDETLRNYIHLPQQYVHQYCLLFVYLNTHNKLQLFSCLHCLLTECCSRHGVSDVSESSNILGCPLCAVFGVYGIKVIFIWISWHSATKYWPLLFYSETLNK